MKHKQPIGDGGWYAFVAFLVIVYVITLLIVWPCARS
jgi:hypothetical protein